MTTQSKDVTKAAERERRRKEYEKSSGGYSSPLQEFLLKAGAAIIVTAVILGVLFFVAKPLWAEQSEGRSAIIRQEVTDVVNFIQTGIQEADLTVLEAVEQSVLVRSDDIRVETLNGGTEWLVHKEATILYSRAAKETYSYGYNSITGEYLEGTYEEVRSAGQE